VNAGSLDKRIMAKHGKATPEALVESALWECSLFEEHDFRDIKISVKHNDPVVMVQAYRLLSQRATTRCTSGVTEAGPGLPGHHQVGGRLRALLAEGIGDTIRVSLSRRRRGGQGRPGDPRVAQPQAARPRDRRCPSCGRARSTSTPSPSR
jgi:(E)-4-hydroxy-3-methylbut-2-enyl-diphosphate synthase